MRNTPLDKAFRAYGKAEYDLLKLRAQEFPPGTLVKFDIFTATVKEGSLYPDQIYTDIGHMSWRNAKKINISTGGKS